MVYNLSLCISDTKENDPYHSIHSMHSPPGVHNIPWCMDYSIHQGILEVRFIVSFLSANKTIISDEYKENSFLDNISRL